MRTLVKSAAFAGLRGVHPPGAFRLEKVPLGIELRISVVGCWIVVNTDWIPTLLEQAGQPAPAGQPAAEEEEAGFCSSCSHPERRFGARSRFTSGAGLVPFAASVGSSCGDPAPRAGRVQAFSRAVLRRGARICRARALQCSAGWRRSDTGATGTRRCHASSPGVPRHSSHTTRKPTSKTGRSGG